MYYDIHTHNTHSQAEAILNVPLYEVAPQQANHKGRQSLSLHPLTTLTNEWTNVCGLFKTTLLTHKFVAIGEVGMDKRSPTSKTEQSKRLIHFIEMSEELSLPLIIHCVGMHNELEALLRTIHPSEPWILHGHRANPQVTEQLMRHHNILFSFGYNYNEETLKSIPSHRLLIETDEAPSIEEIYARVAHSREITVNTLTQIIEKNWIKYFYR